MSTAAEAIQIEETDDRSRFNGAYKRHDTSFMVDDVNILDSPVFNDEQMQVILDGIVQNIWQKMDVKGLRTSALSDLSTIPYSTLSNIFNYRQSVSLKNLIKLSFALGVSPIELFPYDLNRRKTNGDRFNEITSSLDVESVNYLLDQAAGFVKLKSK